MSIKGKNTSANPPSQPTEGQLDKAENVALLSDTLYRARG
jgi:hypothetical protein